jgi:hypothetical protein
MTNLHFDMEWLANIEMLHSLTQYKMCAEAVCVNESNHNLQIEEIPNAATRPLTMEAWDSS